MSEEISRADDTAVVVPWTLGPELGATVVQRSIDEGSWVDPDDDSLLELELALAGQIECVVPAKRPSSEIDAEPDNETAWLADLFGTRGRAWPFVAAAATVGLMLALALGRAGPRGTAEPAAASLQVVSEPTGARVFVDGKPSGVTPMKVSGLALGAHLVTLESPDGRIAERPVRFDGPQAHILHVELATPVASAEEPATTTVARAWLSLTTEPRMRVDINGVDVGSTPIRRHEVAAGEHVVRMHHGELSIERALDIEVRAGEHLDTRIVFPKGELDFEVEPRARVFLDGRRLGVTPMRAVSLWEGDYEVRLVFPSLDLERIVPVTITGGETSTVEMKL